MGMTAPSGNAVAALAEKADYGYGQGPLKIRIVRVDRKHRVSPRRRTKDGGTGRERL